MRPQPRPQPRNQSPSPRMMVSRLIRQTPNCGYAEVEVIAHNGSHHKPGDVILMHWDEYQTGRPVKRDATTPLKPGWNTPVGELDAVTVAALNKLQEETEMIRTKAATKPTTKPKKTGRVAAKKPAGRVAAKKKKATPTAARKKPNANTRKPSKGKGKKAAR